MNMYSIECNYKFMSKLSLATKMMVTTMNKQSSTIRSDRGRMQSTPYQSMAHQRFVSSAFLLRMGENAN